MVKNLYVSAGGIRDVGLSPGSGRSPGGRHGNPLQYSYLENPMDRGAMGYCPQGCRVRHDRSDLACMQAHVWKKSKLPLAAGATIQREMRVAWPRGGGGARGMWTD